MPEPLNETAGAETAVVVNRRLWTSVNAAYTDGHAERAWGAPEVTWALFGVPDAELQVLGDVSDVDVIGLGCGTAYLSAWPARRGAHPVAVDLTRAQRETARRCQDRLD